MTEFEIPTVEVPQAVYNELVKGKTIADALTALIHNKRKGYSGISREEVELLDVLYFIQEGEEE